MAHAPPRGQLVLFPRRSCTADRDTRQTPTTTPTPDTRVGVVVSTPRSAGDVFRASPMGAAASYAFRQAESASREAAWKDHAAPAWKDDIDMGRARALLAFADVADLICNANDASLLADVLTEATHRYAALSARRWAAALDGDGSGS